jgi:hypothetical protein
MDSNFIDENDSNEEFQKRNGIWTDDEQREYQAAIDRMAGEGGPAGPDDD